MSLLRCARNEGRSIMINSIWEFEVRADRVDEFLQPYSSKGTGAQLFQKGEASKKRCSQT
jgi:hypothetical protein